MITSRRTFRILDDHGFSDCSVVWVYFFHTTNVCIYLLIHIQLFIFIYLFMYAYLYLYIYMYICFFFFRHFSRSIQVRSPWITDATGAYQLAHQRGEDPIRRGSIEVHVFFLHRRIVDKSEWLISWRVFLSKWLFLGGQKGTHFIFQLGELSTGSIPVPLRDNQYDVQCGGSLLSSLFSGIWYHERRIHWHPILTQSSADQELWSYLRVKDVCVYLIVLRLSKTFCWRFCQVGKVVGINNHAGPQNAGLEETKHYETYTPRKRTNDNGKIKARTVWRCISLLNMVFFPATWMSQEVSKWLVSGL